MKQEKKLKTSSNDYCAICGDNHKFAFPTDLFEAFVGHDVVIFAGAGISTEGKNIYPSTFYQEIKEELKAKDGLNLTFSKAMSEYCKRKRGRRELIEKIRSRIEYVRSFPDLYSTTVEFHRTLARIPCIKEIVTTNWDDFFETECHATPFQYEPDMAFWEKTGRKVLKLHGSINNPGSIAATFEDYEDRYKSLNEGLIGSQLKLILANKKLVFVGYSFGDEDFNRIYSFIAQQLGDLIKNPYIVTLDKSKNKKWKELGLKPIYTAGAYFPETLILKLESKKCMLSDDIVNRINKELVKVQIEHKKLSQKGGISKNPEIIYCLSYQDGIIHAFETLFASC